MAAAIVAVMLLLHASLVAYSATRHSPTLNEPAHLVAGLTHWRFGRFDVYRVNPPLVHYVAALPVMAAGFRADWTGFYERPGARPEYQMGEDFVRANGARTVWLIIIARWVCLPFSLIGGIFCYIWSKELWDSNLAGLISLFLWCIDPNILAHAELITSDCAATSLGVAAAYLFWRWLREPTWRNALAAGAFSGLALLTKVLWVILYILWPALWILWLSHGHRRRAVRREPAAGILSPPPFAQLAFLLTLALYILNLGYCFDGTCTPLGEITFVSSALTGAERSGTPGNRFADSWVRQMPVPVPKQYLLGIDLQKCDLEHYGQPSYLRGEWKTGGWWYYYLYGLAVKIPHGIQLMMALAGLTLFVQARPLRFVARNTPIAGISQSFSPFSRARDLLVLMTPPIAVLILVSSQLSFNHHVRYVLPVLGFAYIFAGCTSWWFLPMKRRY